MESIDDEKGKTIKMRVIGNDVKLISEIFFFNKMQVIETTWSKEIVSFYFNTKLKLKNTFRQYRKVIDK